MRRLAPLAVLILSGCSTRVQHGLDERQANEIQTVLVERGFRARKVVEDGRPPTWAVEVESPDAADAVRILAELGLPRPRPAGVRELLKPGLVPDPMEQHVLLLEAQAGELARTLEAVEGVLTARVHLVRPQSTRGVPASPPKASVYLRIQPAAASRLSDMREELRALVAGSVEALDPAGVTLVVSEVVSTVPSRTPAPPPAAGSWALLFIGLGAFGLALVLGCLALRSLAARRRPEPSSSASLALRPVVQGPTRGAA